MNPFFCFLGYKTQFWHTRNGNEFFDLDCTFQFEMPEFQALWQKSHLYFPDNTLRIKFEITFAKPGLRGMQLNMPPSSLKSLSHDLLKMLGNGDRVDFEIKCQDKRFPVHEFVLSGKRDQNSLSCQLIISAARARAFSSISRLLSNALNADVGETFQNTHHY